MFKGLKNLFCYPFLKVKKIIQKKRVNKFFQSTNISKIDALDGYDFEVLVCVLFENSGFKCDLTPKSKDNGVDLIAKKDFHSLAVQTKLYYQHSVGNKAIQEAFTGKNFYNCDIAVVVTNSTFSKSAVETAKKLNVLLIDREILFKIIKQTTKQNEEFFDSLIYNNLKDN